MNESSLLIQVAIQKLCESAARHASFVICRLIGYPFKQYLSDLSAQCSLRLLGDRETRYDTDTSRDTSRVYTLYPTWWPGGNSNNT